MLHIVTWLWGHKYPTEYYRRLSSGLKRNIKQDYEHHFVAPEIEDLPYTEIPGCFCRLRMFDYAWQERMGFKPDDRIVQMDVDTIITGNLDTLFDRNEDFVIMQGGSYQPCPYDGALWMQRAYTNEEVWTGFNLNEAAKTQFHEFPDDQGWLASMLPDAAGWQCGDEVFVYKKPGWPKDDILPERAKLVTFAGKRRPDQITNLDWVRKHWLADDRPKERRSIHPEGPQGFQASSI